MTRAFVLLLLLISDPALAQTASQPDPRIKTITYADDQVIRLQVSVNFHTAIIFDEQVENVAVGNAEAWQITLNENGDALFVKPVGSGGPTNMTVITDARVYSFELLPAFGPTPDAAFTVRFRHASHIVALEADSDRPRLGFYRLAGARALRPVGVTDDGVRTLVEWQSEQPIPAVFALDEQGRETLIEGHMRDGLYVIDAVHRSLVFRMDRQSARATRVQSRERR